MIVVSPPSPIRLCVEVIRTDRGCPDRTFKAAKWDPEMGGDGNEDNVGEDGDDDDGDGDGGDDSSENDDDEYGDEDHAVGGWYARSEGE